MKPILTVRIKQKGAHIPDTVQPIFNLSIKETQHHDNINDKELSDKERNKVTRITYSIIGVVLNGKPYTLLSEKSLHEAQEKYDEMLKNCAVDYELTRKPQVMNEQEAVNELPEPPQVEIKS